VWVLGNPDPDPNTETPKGTYPKPIPKYSKKPIPIPIPMPKYSKKPIPIPKTHTQILKKTHTHTQNPIPFCSQFFADQIIRI